MKHFRQANHLHAYPLGGFIGVITAVISIFFVIPLFFTSLVAHLALQSCFTLITLSTIYALKTTRFVLWIGLFLIIPFAIIDALSVMHNSLHLMAIAYGFYCVFLALAIVTIGKMMLKVRIIDTNLIFGAITIYLFAGVLWAKLYFLTDLVFSSSFHGNSHMDWNGGLGAVYENQFDLLYYSFTTLSTLGVGDITPIHRLARSLTILEAMFGQLFVATVIAKMVSVWRPVAMSDECE